MPRDEFEVHHLDYIRVLILIVRCFESPRISQLINCAFVLITRQCGIYWLFRFANIQISYNEDVITLLYCEWSQFHSIEQWNRLKWWGVTRAQIWFTINVNRTVLLIEISISKQLRALNLGLNFKNSFDSNIPSSILYLKWFQCESLSFNR